jgi:hypothetical protein
MFTEIANLTQAAKLSGVTMTLRPAPDHQMYVTVSFILPPVTAEKVWDTPDANAQRYVDLRSALSTPVVVTAKPEDILGAIINKLSALSAPVTEAATVYNEADISALLKSAVSNAPKAEAKPAAPKEPTSKKKADAKTPAPTTQSVSEPEPELADADEEDDFSDFSSL